MKLYSRQTSETLLDNKKSPALIMKTKIFIIIFYHSSFKKVISKVQNCTLDSKY